MSGGAIKMLSLKILIKVYFPNVILIQETMSTSAKAIEEFFGLKGCPFSASGRGGQYGGILIDWKSSLKVVDYDSIYN